MQAHQRRLTRRYNRPQAELDPASATVWMIVLIGSAVAGAELLIRAAFP
jgi:hypothetical protein